MHRLNVFPIEMPLLRDRLEDVPLLAAHFVQALGQQEGHIKRFSAGALVRLGAHRWPGNVRELRNAVQRTYMMTAGSDRRTTAARRRPGRCFPAGYSHPSRSAGCGRGRGRGPSSGFTDHRLFHSAGEAHHDSVHLGPSPEPPRAHRRCSGHQHENAVQPVERLRRARRPDHDTR